MMVNSCKRLTIIANSSILDIAAILGLSLHVIEIMFTSGCYFFLVQQCTFSFGSWSYTISQINLTFLRKPEDKSKLFSGTMQFYFCMLIYVKLVHNPGTMQFYFCLFIYVKLVHSPGTKFCQQLALSQHDQHKSIVFFSKLGKLNTEKRVGK